MDVHASHEMGYDDGQMGSWLSDLVGVNIQVQHPEQTLATQGTSGLSQQISSQVVTNQQIQSQAYQATQKTLADKVAYFLVKNKKVIAGVLVAGAVVTLAVVVMKKTSKSPRQALA